MFSERTESVKLRLQRINFLIRRAIFKLEMLCE